VLYCSGSMCVGVTVTPTHIEPEQYNTWSKSTISPKLLKMDVLTFETRCAVNNEIIKTSDIKLVYLYSTIKLMHGPINVRNKSTISRKLLKMDVLTFETRWAVNSEIIKTSDIKLVCLYSTIKMMHGPINVRFSVLLRICRFVYVVNVFL
jgi:hypothetical protein